MHTIRQSIIIKIISVMIICVFAHEQIGWVEEGQPVWAGMDIAADMGKVTSSDFGSGSAKETIINIQDAHSSFEAQKSIVGILDELTRNFDINVIGLEGAEGPVDISLLRTFPDAAIKHDTASDLMKKGLMSAGEFFSIVSEKKIKVYGIEDDDLYQENIKAFRNIIGNTKENRKSITEILDVLGKLGDKIFSPELLEFNDFAQRHEKDLISFTRYWEYLSGIISGRGNEYAPAENMAKLIRTIEIEKSIDFDKANTERDILINELTETLPKGVLEGLVLNSLNFKLGKISAAEFHGYLLKTAKENNLDIDRYIELKGFREYVSEYESLDLAGLYRELSECEDNIRQQLFRTSEESDLFALIKFFRFTDKLFRLNLTNDDMEYIVKKEQSIDANIVKSHVGLLSAKYSVDVVSDTRIDGIFESFHEAREFYNTVQKRNNAMIQRTLKAMRLNGEEIAAMVTGGFHSNGLRDIVRDKGLSYFVIAPKFEGGKERPYIAVLTNKAGPYMEYIEEGGHTLAVSPLCYTGDARKLFGFLIGTYARAYSNGEELEPLILDHYRGFKEEFYDMEVEREDWVRLKTPFRPDDFARFFGFTLDEGGDPELDKDGRFKHDGKEARSGLVIEELNLCGEKVFIARKYEDNRLLLQAALLKDDEGNMTLDLVPAAMRKELWRVENRKKIKDMINDVKAAHQSDIDTIKQLLAGDVDPANNDLKEDWEYIAGNMAICVRDRVRSGKKSDIKTIRDFVKVVNRRGLRISIRDIKRDANLRRDIIKLVRNLEPVAVTELIEPDKTAREEAAVVNGTKKIVREVSHPERSEGSQAGDRDSSSVSEKKEKSKKKVIRSRRRRGFSMRNRKGMIAPILFTVLCFLIVIAPPLIHLLINNQLHVGEFVAAHPWYTKSVGLVLFYSGVIRTLWIILFPGDFSIKKLFVSEEPVKKKKYGNGFGWVAYSMDVFLVLVIVFGGIYTFSGGASAGQDMVKEMDAPEQKTEVVINQLEKYPIIKIPEIDDKIEKVDDMRRKVITLPLVPVELGYGIVISGTGKRALLREDFLESLISEMSYIQGLGVRDLKIAINYEERIRDNRRANYRPPQSFYACDVIEKVNWKNYFGSNRGPDLDERIQLFAEIVRLWERKERDAKNLEEREDHRSFATGPMDRTRVPEAPKRADQWHSTTDRTRVQEAPKRADQGQMTADRDRSSGTVLKDYLPKADNDKSEALPDKKVKRELGSVPGSVERKAGSFVEDNLNILVGLGAFLVLIVFFGSIELFRYSISTWIKRRRLKKAVRVTGEKRRKRFIRAVQGYFDNCKVKSRNDKFGSDDARRKADEWFEKVRRTINAVHDNNIVVYHPIVTTEKSIENLIYLLILAEGDEYHITDLFSSVNDTRKAPEFLMEAIATLGGDVEDYRMIDDGKTHYIECYLVEKTRKIYYYPGVDPTDENALSERVKAGFNVYVEEFEAGKTDVGRVLAKEVLKASLPCLDDAGFVFTRGDRSSSLDGLEVLSSNDTATGYDFQLMQPRLRAGKMKKSAWHKVFGKTVPPIYSTAWIHTCLMLFMLLFPTMGLSAEKSQGEGVRITSESVELPRKVPVWSPYRPGEEPKTEVPPATGKAVPKSVKPVVEDTLKAAPKDGVTSSAESIPIPSSRKDSFIWRNRQVYEANPGRVGVRNYVLSRGKYEPKGSIYKNNSPDVELNRKPSIIGGEGDTYKIPVTRDEDDEDLEDDVNQSYPPSLDWNSNRQYFAGDNEADKEKKEGEEEDKGHTSQRRQTTESVQDEKSERYPDIWQGHSIIPPHINFDVPDLPSREKLEEDWKARAAEWEEQEKEWAKIRLEREARWKKTDEEWEKAENKRQEEALGITTVIEEKKPEDMYKEEKLKYYLMKMKSGSEKERIETAENLIEFGMFATTSIQEQITEGLRKAAETDPSEKVKKTAQNAVFKMNYPILESTLWFISWENKPFYIVNSIFLIVMIWVNYSLHEKLYNYFKSCLRRRKKDDRDGESPKTLKIKPRTERKYRRAGKRHILGIMIDVIITAGGFSFFLNYTGKIPYENQIEWVRGFPSGLFLGAIVLGFAAVKIMKRKTKRIHKKARKRDIKGMIIGIIIMAGILSCFLGFTGEIPFEIQIGVIQKIMVFFSGLFSRMIVLGCGAAVIMTAFPDIFGLGREKDEESSLGVAERDKPRVLFAIPSTVNVNEQFLIELIKGVRSEFAENIELHFYEDKGDEKSNLEYLDKFEAELIIPVARDIDTETFVGIVREKSFFSGAVSDLFRLCNPTIASLDDTRAKYLNSEKLKEIERTIARLLPRIVSGNINDMSLGIMNKRMKAISRELGRNSRFTSGFTGKLEKEKGGRIISIRANTTGELKLIAEGHREMMRNKKVKDNLFLQVRVVVNEEDAEYINESTKDALMKKMGINNIDNFDLLIVPEKKADSMTVSQIYHTNKELLKYDLNQIVIVENKQNGRTLNDISEKLIFFEYTGYATTELYMKVLENLAIGKKNSKDGWIIFDMEMSPENMQQLVREIEEYRKALIAA